MNFPPSQYLLLLFSLLALPIGSLAATRAEESPSKEILLQDALVLRPLSRGARSPIHIDPIEYELVNGRWKAPQAGDPVQGPNSKQNWEAVKVKEGRLQHPALQGGYLYWSVNSDNEKVMLLEAAGHSLVYVNGEPRVGDPYSNGILRIPILLRKGNNNFLFAAGRGSLSAKLVPVQSTALLSDRDPTLPDYILGENSALWGGVVVINAGLNALDSELEVTLNSEKPLRQKLPRIEALSVRKVPFQLPAHAEKLEKPKLTLRLVPSAIEEKAIPAPIQFDLQQKNPTELHKRTFISQIDGSVQYYAVQPAKPSENKEAAPGLILTLHGAGVEGMGQAAAYSSIPGVHIVAATNRRPFGFDWEDWGRFDAIEVLELAQKSLKTDPRRTYLTGHSMGGHGTWHVGVTFPDRFAAIAPSAGWVSFASYGGGRRSTETTPMQDLLLRASLPSQTLNLKNNLSQLGVYILHGDADDNVPVDQARTMRKELAEFHPDFAYYERPGAGHWWGNQCVHWPPLIDFLIHHELPDPQTLPKIDFVTASPAISARYRWVTIEAQIKSFELSSVQLNFDPKEMRIQGSTKNVERLIVDLRSLKAADKIQIRLDGSKLENLSLPDSKKLTLIRDQQTWKLSEPTGPEIKNPQRSGPFKEAFRNRMVFIYGTKGTAEENAWSFAKARYDAETFWYRGNGSIEVVSDSAFDPAKYPDQNVILYGNADTHGCWKSLLGDSPVQVKRGQISIGKKDASGENLACLFVRPRSDSKSASVGVVSGTGLPGLHLTERIPYFSSGVEFPDCTILDTDMLLKGYAGVRMTGFFDNSWGVDKGEFLWK